MAKYLASQIQRGQLRLFPGEGQYGPCG